MTNYVIINQRLLEFEVIMVFVFHVTSTYLFEVEVTQNLVDHETLSIDCHSNSLGPLYMPSSSSVMALSQLKKNSLLCSKYVMI